MLIKAFFAGFGGQGVLSMGHILAYAGMLEDKHVTYFPSYGAEVRGGTANCTVAIGDEEIASPIASEPEIVVAMNQPSMLRFAGTVSEGGFLFINSSLITDRPSRVGIEVIEVPATQLAEEIGASRAANMVMLGAVVGRYNVVAPESVHLAMEKMFASKPKLINVNREAFDRGLAFIRGSEGKR